MRLAGKTAAITGAASGIGLAIATRFAAEGAAVVLAARSLDDLERVRKDCERVGAASASVVPTDITDEANVQALVSSVLDAHGRIDCFVANAGTSYGMLTDKRYNELFTYDLAIVEQVIRVNTIGTWLCLKAALPLMGQGSSFVIVGSETGRMASAGSGIYAVSKVTNDTMTLIASKEMSAQGVRVNRLTPGGMVDTQLFGPAGMPEQSTEIGAPMPSVSAYAVCTSAPGSTTWVAPASMAALRRPSSGSETMICAAPIWRAAITVSKPIGPAPAMASTSSGR